MKHFVNYLSGPLLDEAVALAEGYQVVVSELYGREIHQANGHLVDEWEPSTDGRIGMNIIERERIYLEPLAFSTGWKADASEDTCQPVFGPTALIAAMRAYVVSKLGEEIELP